MKVNTSDRLKEIMEARNLRQVDIIELCKPFCLKFNAKLQKSDLSQYLSGKVVPSQYKLTILGLALNVSESWLMGYDVPQGRDAEEKAPPKELSESEEYLLTLFRSVPEEKQEKVLDMIRVALSLL